MIRTFIALPAGIAHMPRVRFHVYTFLGSWPWCFGLAWFGMKLGENWRELGKYFHQFDIVIGIARLMRITLPENFNRPFSSDSFIGFWSRWHITLSEWLKTYVYYPVLMNLMRRYPSPALEPASRVSVSR